MLAFKSTILVPGVSKAANVLEREAGCEVVNVGHRRPKHLDHPGATGFLHLLHQDVPRADALGLHRDQEEGGGADGLEKVSQKIKSSSLPLTNHLSQDDRARPHVLYVHLLQLQPVHTEEPERRLPELAGRRHHPFTCNTFCRNSS